MTVQREAPTRDRRARPELDAEQEVDLGRAWRTVAARWWVVAAAVIVGVALGYVLAVGGKQVYKADATIYLGQPWSATGAAPVQGLQTNPTAVSQLLQSEFVLRQAARRSGLRVGALRGQVSSKPVSSANQRRAAAGQAPLVEISVKGRSARRVQRASNALAAIVVNRISGFVNLKIDRLGRQQAAQERELRSLGRRVVTAERALDAAGPRGADVFDLLVLTTQVDNAEQRRTVVEEDLLETETLLAFAREVERARIFDRAVAVETTARSTRNSMLVGAMLGLIVGLLAALLWDPIARRTGHATA